MANGKLLGGKQSGGITTVTFQDGASNTVLVLPESGNVASTDGATVDNSVPRFDGVSGKLQGSGVTVDDTGRIGDSISGWNESIKSLELNDISLSSGLGESVAPNVNLRTNTFINSLGYAVYKKNGLARQFIMGTHGFTWHLAANGIAGNTATFIEQLRLDVQGNLILKSPTGGLGYGTGAGGTVTQLTSKSTAVTLNKPSGRITMHNASLAAGASVTFSFNNSLLTASDTIKLTSNSFGLNYKVEEYGIVSGACGIRVENISAVSKSEALVINFNIIKGATA